MVTGKKVMKQLVDIEKKMMDKKTQAKIKVQVEKGFEQGRKKISKIWAQVKDKENQEKVIAKIKRMEKKYEAYEKRAVVYTEKNPEKALAISAAAGILVGAIWGAFYRKK
jgi:ElaB/YqjD/DUF883 family membrane-anchored ribosome-binding protein